MEIFHTVIYNSGLVYLTWGNIFMWFIAFALMYLAIEKEFEPLLLLPIGFGILVTNLPITFLMKPGEGLLWRFFHYGVEWEVIPPLIFMGIGALTDFGPLIANPKTLLLGSAAQIGIYITFFGALALGFDVKQAAAISIIGGADGPTTIYLGSKLAPELLGATAVAAYSYMAMVPLIQPPVMKLLTTAKERKIVMKQLRPVGRLEKICFPVVSTLVISLLVPCAAPLMAMLMLGNLFRESGVVERLSKAAQNELLNIITIFLGISVGATMTADNFLRPQVIFVFCLGLFAFAASTATGILLAKLMNLFLKEKINPLIGSAGVSAVPMAARVSQKVASQEFKRNYILMHAMGPNVAGVIGTTVAAGMFIAMLQ